MSREKKMIGRKKVWVVFIGMLDIEYGEGRNFQFRYVWRPRNICDTRELARAAARRWRIQKGVATKEKKYEFSGPSVNIDFDMPDRPDRKRTKL